MINFTDDRLYVKGTCNVVLSDPTSGDIYYQSPKFSTGNITPSTNLNEIRAGLGNPIAAMIPSDSGLTVDFEAADFSLWAKAAQLGATYTYAAPVPACQVVTATGTALKIDVADGKPVAPLGMSEPICFVQATGVSSLIAGADHIAHKISADGSVTEFTASPDIQYKVWYYVQKDTASCATISSLIDPKVVRFEAQIAVYSNRAGSSNTGTRVGWLYITIPYLKLQGDATITGDQSNNDTTKVSGQAIAYESTIVTPVCSDCDTSTLGYYVYSPDEAADVVIGLAVIGGVVSLKVSTKAQIPVRLVMADGSLVIPASYSKGFTYTGSGLPDGTSADTSGLITAGAMSGDGEVTVKYAAAGKTFSTVLNVSVTE